MGKKRSRSTYISKGQRNSIDRGLIKAVRRETPEVEKALNKIAAWRAGKNPWITIKNPSNETHKRYIKVKANSYYGDPRGRKVEGPESE